MQRDDTRLQQCGLLFAAMEPSPELEEEFQHWYDTEHFPERRDTPGFLTAARFVCIDGWPRYLAMYDLADIGVLGGPDYARIAVDNYSHWTGRIVARVWGQYRAAARQIHPGGQLLGASGNAARLVVWRFRGLAEHDAATIVEGLRRIYADQPETAQLRVFAAEQPDGTDCLGIVELHAPWTPPAGAVAALGAAKRRLDAVNTYVRYERRWPGTYPKGT
ncbi:DUF4286 family protein [Falsiroseomonas oryzae]|uniref:DUF4286 family protein n=1 Tax=Falsiroseomonas oryzae TaxID=2766473 RepID=UPI0022EA3912|nr:DUF4286 family protein [Roseomonas sp. MO-31]